MPQEAKKVAPFDSVTTFRAWGVPCQRCPEESGHYKSGGRWLCWTHASLRLEAGLTDFRNHGGESEKDPNKPIPAAAGIAFSEGVKRWDLENPTRPDWEDDVRKALQAGAIHG